MTTENARPPVVVPTVPTRKPRVAFQGERGAYGDEAIERVWHGDAYPVPSWTFDDVIGAVRLERVEYGILPIENTVIGPIVVTQTLLAMTPGLVVVDETTIDVHHALLALPGTSLPTLATVMSHPVALCQCALFLAQHPHLIPRASYDTAGAAREVAAHGKPDEAAIASVRAAERYGLAILAENIQDRPDNQTRFVIVTHERRKHQ